MGELTGKSRSSCLGICACWLLHFLIHCQATTLLIQRMLNTIIWLVFQFNISLFFLFSLCTLSARLYDALPSSFSWWLMCPGILNLFDINTGIDHHLSLSSSLSFSLSLCLAQLQLRAKAAKQTNKIPTTIEKSLSPAFHCCLLLLALFIYLFIALCAALTSHVSAATFAFSSLFLSRWPIADCLQKRAGHDIHLLTLFLSIFHDANLRADSCWHEEFTKPAVGTLMKEVRRAIENRAWIWVNFLLF